jgi:beta-fructofuranosidase
MPADPRRPGYHFTAPQGWINDPLGVTWRETSTGGRYELFYQFNPAAPVWVPECRWGQATSRDLVRWADPRTALEPGPEESGCWSGSVVVRDDGTPVIVYTSVPSEAPGQGRVALAAGDPAWRRWTADPGGPVLGAPAPESGLAHFRDPFVWWAGEEWRMAVGAGSTGGHPSVRQYSSPDLRRWREDGVLAEPAAGVPESAGAVWECPQLFRLDGAWVLIVSVWDEVPGYVACAVGDYDGRRFTARSWHRLAAEPLYATTAFLDAEGRRCAMSWVRESGPVDGAWAGTLSVPWLLVRDGHRVGVRPHPDVESLRTGVLAELGPADVAADPLVLGPLDACCDVEVEVGPDGPFLLGLHDDGGRLLGVNVDVAAGTLTLSPRGGSGSQVPVRLEPDGGMSLRLLVDASVVEVFPSGGAVAAARTSPEGGPLTLTLTGAGARVRRLVAHGMERALD